MQNEKQENGNRQRVHDSILDIDTEIGIFNIFLKGCIRYIFIFIVE
jgi:hypothetical protein